MLLSLNWLRRHVDLDGVSADELAERLTMSTCEVEGVARWAPHLADVTVGHVVERERHPDADKLSLCRVDVGDGDPVQIVCGAPNVAAGMRVAVATPGTVLPGDFKIKKSKIRGQASAGMICSVRELDLGDEHDGIWALPGEPPVGSSVASALGLEDWVLEVDNKSLTHRPDLWGHRGVAREAAAILRRPLRPLDLSLPALGDAEPVPLAVDDRACSRYLGLSIDGVVNGPAPDWMRYLLLAVGQRPIDLCVDLSNFVMLDLGQPNHAFDRDELAEDGIRVRLARAGERITTLDGEERELTAEDLLITSGDAPVALAGVMGGEGSKVRPTTTRLLLEVACFDPATVRRTSARLGLRTDSSSRFEKHLDPTLPEKAAAHFAHTLRELQPDVSFPARLGDAGEWTDPSTTVSLRSDVVRRDLGAPLEDSDVEDALHRLGFGVVRGSGALEVRVPAARATKDVTMERDLVEEVGRLHGYGNVPEAAMVAPVVPPPHDARRALVRAVEDRLAGPARFRQAIGYSFQTDAVLASVGAADAPHVRIENPVAPDQSRVRRDVLPSLLATLPAARRDRATVRVFEVGKGYRPEDVAADGAPREVHQCALVVAGEPLAADAPFGAGAYAELRAVVDDLVEALGLEAAAWSAADEAPPWAHPVRRAAATVGPDAAVALLAALDPVVARALGLEGELASDVACAVLDVDALLAAPRRGSRYRPIPRFPGVKVDVACVAPDEMPAADVRAAIEEAGKGAVRDLEPFDVFRGEQVGAGRRSLAWHVVLQSDDRTLTDADAQKFLGRLERLLDRRGAELRK